MEYPTRFIPLEDLSEVPVDVRESLDLGGFQKYNWHKKSETNGLFHILSSYHFSNPMGSRPAFHFRRRTGLDSSINVSIPRIDHRYSHYVLGLDGLAAFKQNARQRLSSANFSTLFSITKIDLEDRLEEKWNAGALAETYLTFASSCGVPLALISNCSPRILDKWFWFGTGAPTGEQDKEFRARVLMSQYTEDEEEFSSMLKDIPVLWVDRLTGK